jgi:hypothetical protein
VARYQFAKINSPGPLVEGGEWLMVSGGDLPWPIALRVGFDEVGRLACTGLVAGFDLGDTQDVAPGYRIVDFDLREMPISSRDLRRIRTGEILEAAARNDDVKALLGPRPTRVKKPKRAMPGRRGHDPAFYEQFAEAYVAQARQSRKSPVRALAQRFDVSEAAIYRWVGRARELGFLQEESTS